MASPSHARVTSPSAAELAAFARRRAIEIGFSACGITDLSPNRTRDAFDEWLRRGFHATMGYMPRQATIRRAPAKAWREAKSVVVVLHNYYAHSATYPGGCRIARYAQGDDYHNVTADLLRELARSIEAFAESGSFRYYVDSGPLPERELASRAGLGWIGKNTMLINPAIGSFTFIGCLLTDLVLEADPPFEADRCGSCTRCLDACPTGALPEPRVLDANRCISYLTIESRSDIPEPLRAAVGDNLFGCDICQDVCPWNVKFARETSEPRFRPPSPDGRPRLESVETMNQAEFDAAFGHTAMERTRLDGLKRNARVVLENRVRRPAALRR